MGRVVSLTRRQVLGTGVTALSALALAGCASNAPKATYDLSAARDFGLAHAAPRGLLVVAVPTALQVLDTERIVIQPRAGEVTYASDGQWSDRLPKLLQARIIQTFENASRLRAVGRPEDRLMPDWQLVTDIRQFGVQAGGSSPAAVVELSAKLVTDRGGRIVAGKVFSATAPGGTDSAAAAGALDQALGRVLRDMVRWASGLI